MKRYFILILITSFIMQLPSLFALHKPKIMIVLVIDQFAHHYIPKLQTHFKDGFKLFLTKGICYENAHQPHGAPSTAPGHAAISTGTIPFDHGIVLNSWIDEHGNKITFGNDDSPHAKLLTSTRENNIGKSSHHLLVDTLSDNVMLYSTDAQKNNVFSLSYKARAAIALAGKRGHAIWFDAHAQQFTSSKAYFNYLPSWVNTFNQTIKQQILLPWKLRFAPHDRAYAYDFIHDSTYATQQKKSVSNTTSLFLRTPAANKMLLDLAQKCIINNFSNEDKGTFLLWVSLSSLDMLGHEYGPHSLKIIDMLYHLDKQIGDFIHFCEKYVGAKNTCFVLTADHGVAPIPELLQKQGLSLAHRTHIKPFIKKINAYIERKYGISNTVKFFKANQFYLNQHVLLQYPHLLQKLKKFLKKQRGIKNIWTRNELLEASFAPDSLELLFKNQCHPTHSGDLICMSQPFCAITKHSTGTSHRSPYDYDTHVPLIIYQNRCNAQHIVDRVWIPQLPVTLAKIIGVPKPSSARYDCLPEV